MSRRRLLLPVTWLAATLAAVALAWFAVTSAIADTSEQVLPAAARAAPAIGSAQSTGRSTTTLPPSDASSSSPQQAPGVSTSPPRTSLPASSRSSAPEDRSSPPESTSSAPPPATSSRVFSSPGGSVTVECSGSAISLVFSSPTDGYTQKVSRSGPDEVEVKFFADGRPTYEVKAVCVNGQPVQPPSDDG